MVGLLELRHDIGCDVPTDGQLTHPNPHGIKIDHGRSPDPARQVFDVTDDAALIARNRSARILVVTDKIVTFHHQLPFVESFASLVGRSSYSRWTRERAITTVRRRTPRSPCGIASAA